ncbi:MAG TPA: VIT1/CCC1 transporter family protein [Actinomycetota bacterium]|nr:VIT1/CCC1 transporter family protein [Actinomycetota bacterium]
METRADQFREHWADEMESAALYRSMAESSSGEQREIFLELAAAEERHAAHWSRKLRELGEPQPRLEDHRRSFKTRLLLWLTRRLGPRAVLPLVQSAEVADAGHYDRVEDATPAMAVDERIHARVVGGLSPSSARAGILRGERWHRGDASGSVRAAVFGINDGLVSNLALVMGVAGSQASGRFVMLAGLAGLLAGAFSMAAGEYISVRSQRELFEREIALEAEEVEAMPEEEANELALIYRAKGIPREQAEALATRIMADPRSGLDTMVREELGLNPEELGSPQGVAASSFVSFATGALVPLVPYLVGSGTAAFVGAIIAAGVALFAVGAGISLLTGKGVLRSGLRQVLVGAVAAAITFGVGRLVGVSVS